MLKYGSKMAVLTWAASVLISAVAAYFVVSQGPFVGVLLTALVGLLILSLLAPLWAAPTLVVMAVPFLRPNLFGETYSVIGAALLLAAAFLALVEPRWRQSQALLPPLWMRGVVLWVTLAYLWLTLRSAVGGSGDIQAIVIGGATMVLSLTCLIVILANPECRVRVLKLLVGIIVAVAVSYAVTGLIWLGFGIGSGVIGNIQVGGIAKEQPVYFPFTATLSLQPVFGLYLPRLTGFGREPGWMAMYLAGAYCLIGRLNWNRRWVKLVLVFALLGTVSTAGFGVFIIAFAVNFMLNGRGRSQFESALRFLFGSILLCAAAYTAWFAPVFGYAAKSTQNITSATERSAATQAGLNALLIDPFAGGMQASAIGAVSLVAAIAAFGLPFSLLLCIAIARPLIGASNRARVLPFVVTIGLTILVAQPPLDSVWAYGFLLAGAALLREQRPPQKIERHPLNQTSGRAPRRTSRTLSRYP